MNKYKVVYESGVDGSPEFGVWPKAVTATIEAHSYGTNATSGAGLVADFYVDASNIPIATFGRVHSVRKLKR